MTKNIAMDLLSYHSLGPPAATLEIQLTVELLRAVGQSLSQEAESQQAGSLVSVEAESCTPQSHSLYADTSCRTPSSLFRGYSIIRSRSNDLGISNVSRIHFGFGFIVNADPDSIIE